MPARVHALLVVRPDGRSPSDTHLTRTLNALRAQTRPVEALTIVVCGKDDAVTRVAASSGAEAIISAPRSTSFARALELASRRIEGDAVWLLAQDTAPHPEALARLAGALETAPSVALAVPKLVSWHDDSHIVSFGETLTRAGRAVGLADGEHDQGQHDGREDVLGADIRGVLVRAEAWRLVAGIDPALAGADEGLDLGVRLRLRGGRVVVAPGARIAVAGDGVAGLPEPDSVARRLRIAYAERAAQLHRRLAYAPAAAVPVHWLSLLPLALWRTITALLAKRPEQIAPEWMAAVGAAVRLPGLARARRRIRRGRTIGWAQLAPLRMTSHDRRRMLDSPAEHRRPRDIRFFSGGGAWVVLAMLVVSAVSFTALLAWPVLGGGGLLPLRPEFTQLWADTAFGARALGWETFGPADPFSYVMAGLGSLSAAEPSRALVVLWILALPLAALGGWFAATRVTVRSGLRAAAAIGWALAPTFLTALVLGHPGGVIVHLTLPWLAYCAVIAHRSWTGAGFASLLLLVIIACAPALAPLCALVWVVGVTACVIRSHSRGLARVVWMIIPTAVVFAPLVVHQVRAGNGWAIFADPGVALGSPQAGDSVSDRLLLAGGFPTADAALWAGVLAPGVPIVLVALIAVPLLLCALLAPFVASRGSRAWSGIIVVVGALSIIAAIASPSIALSARGSTVIPLWAGFALSVAWLCLWAAALVTLSQASLSRPARTLSALVVLAAIIAAAVPALTADLRGVSALRNGPSSTLPAYVAAEGEASADAATFILTPHPSGALVSTVVWGGSETLGGQTTLQSARTVASPGDRITADLTADLVAGSGAPVDELARHGVSFILTVEADDESDRARATRVAAEAALDRQPGLEGIGVTDRGTLWRVTDAVVAQRSGGDDIQTVMSVSALVVVIVAILLALPTFGRDGRRRSAQNARGELV